MRGGQVGIGGGEDADIDPPRRGRADGSDLAILQDAQELGLERGRHVADFVQEERAAVSLLEVAFAIRHRAGERPFEVPEEGGLDELRRDRDAVDRDERLLRARAAVVDRARDQLFASAAFAGDEHAGFAKLVQLFDLAQDAPEVRAAADEAGEAPVLAPRGRRGW